MLEAIIVKFAVAIATKLLNWIGSQLIDVVDHISFKSKMGKASKDAIENKKTSGLEDMLNNIGQL